MGRNLNALLNSAVRERREQSVERAGEEAADESSSGRAAGGAAEEGGASNDASSEERRALDGGETDARASDSQAADVATLVVPRARPFARPFGVPRPRAVPSPTDDGSDTGTGDVGSAEAEPDPESSPSAAEAPREGDGTDEEAGVRADPVEPRVTRVVQVEQLPPAPGDPPRPGDRLRMIGVERIRRGVFQPRRFFDQEALQELADSLKAQGMIQPVIVRPFGDAFELIAGERRWRAAQIAGLDEIPAIVREMEDRTVAAVSLIENIQREDLNPLEEAQALTRLCDEFGMTHASVAESIGRSRAAVSNLMRLLELHDEVKVLVDKGELDMGHARALLRVPKVDQPALALRVAKQGLTVRAVEKLIRTGVDKEPSASPAAETPDPDVERLERRLSTLLGAAVSIRSKAGKSGAGRLEIRYNSLEELEGILDHIK